MGTADDGALRAQGGTWRAPERLAQLGLVLAVLVAGAPSLGFGFLAWDDPEHLTRNPLVVGQDAALRDLVLTPALGYPIPITLASYRLEYALFGLTPWVYHATNVALHAGIALLAFRLGRRLGLGVAGALLGSLVFALHPASAECVSWVTGRKDLLAALLGLGALSLSLRHDVLSRAASVALYALALLSKPSAAPLVALVPLLAMWSEGGAPARAARATVPYLLVLAPITYLGVLGQRAVGATAETFAPLSRAHGAWYAFGHHARLALFAEEPTAKYLPSPWPPAVPGPVDYAGVALLVLFAVALLLCRARRRAVVAGVVLAAASYFPVSSVWFPLTRYLADSYVYLPLLGMGWVLGAALDELALPRPALARLERALPALVGCALVPLFWLSSARFESDLSLWTQTRERFGQHPRVCRQWANAVATQAGAQAGVGALDTCIAQFGPALFEKNRGLLLVELGHDREAEAWLARAAARTPGDETVARYLAAVRARLGARATSP